MSEKTDKPTHRRLQDARKKGTVLKSAEVTSTVAYFVLVTAMVFLLPWIWKRLQRLFDLIWSVKVITHTPENLNDVLAAICMDMFEIAMPITLVVAFTAMLAGFAQVGSVFSAEPVKPKFDVLNPASGFMNLFSTQNLFSLFKLMLKLSLMTATIVWIIVDETDYIMRLMYAMPVEGAHVGARLLFKMFIAIGVLYLMHAAIDYGHQYYEFMKKMRMTKDEIKREYKDSEGDPHIKSERRRLAREIAFSAPGEGTRKASVLVVNPTHFAVAIYYEAGVTDLPIVVEKALEDQALFLRSVAREAGVPIFEYPQLARDLFAKVPVSSHIPAELFSAVAEVLLWVQRMKSNNSKQGTRKP